MSFSPPLALVAAVLSDAVYHDYTNDIVPDGWVLLESHYDSQDQSGYYAEVWGQPKLNASTGQPVAPLSNADGSPNISAYAEIMIVNRGTTFQSAVGGPGLADTAADDRSHTLDADFFTIVNQTSSPQYARLADAFLATIEADPSTANTRIIAAGHSLGGLAADAQTVFAIRQGYTNVSADTFNALPFTASMASAALNETALTQQQVDQLNLDINNFYVGNEQFTQNSIVGTAVGTTIHLPALPAWSSVISAFAIHSADATVAQTFREFYPNPNASDYAAALKWLGDAYVGVPASEIPAITAVLTGAPAPKIDAAGSIVTENADGTISIAYDLDPQSGAPQENTTFSSVVCLSTR